MKEGFKDAQLKTRTWFWSMESENPEHDAHVKINTHPILHLETYGGALGIIANGTYNLEKGYPKNIS